MDQLFGNIWQKIVWVLFVFYVLLFVTDAYFEDRLSNTIIALLVTVVIALVLKDIKTKK
ncbi:MAG TPA: hypothetical protein PLS49_07090 [Candidatus Woesebacteria bacterium]|nr:hypothetical protein [Candidatus Woesebacteria bacterium]